MLDRYEQFLSEEEVSSLRYRGRRLSDHSILTVNTAADNGGVAQILNSIVPLLQDLGVDIDWTVLDADESFFDITKRFHNGLQGEEVAVSDADRDQYISQNETFAEALDDSYDFVLVHDPQPAAMIQDISVPSVLRIHVDMSHPDKDTFDFLQSFIESYNEIIVSKETYQHSDVSVPTRVIHPATDPFTDINHHMDDTTVSDLLEERVGSYEHLLTQVSRFDKWKDPIGVIDVFERVREHKQCTLFLLGSDAADDPEGQAIYESVCDRREESPFAEDIVVIMENNAELVNAAQRGSDVIIQKSTREGFGLTVSEAMLKGTPVVASDVGGIPCQIDHGKTGFLHGSKDYDAFASTITSLLDDEEMKRIIGRRAKEHVEQQFLMTRLLDDYLSLFESHLLG